MAKKIQGITIEIDGDTKKLNDAVKDVASQSKKFSDELKDVQRLLKFDPKNTELLAQKQKLLAESVDHTKNKLQALKDAKSAADKTMAEGGKVSEEQYRKLQREIVQAEQNLKNLETTQKNFNSKLKTMGDNIGNFGSKTKQAGQAMMPISTAAGAAGVAALVMSNQFDDAMAKVSTIADESAVPFEELKKQIIEASNQTGVAADQIAEDVYNAISAGQKTEDAAGFVVNANKLAQAGFAEQAQALDVLTTILNAYELSSGDANKVMDVLIQTQNKGKTTVGELSAVMGKIIPTAKASNVGIEQLGASYAILTSKGIAATEATTYSNAMLNELAKTGSKSSDVLKKKTGKSFAELSADGESLSDVLSILQDEAVKSGLSLSDMFGSSEAAKAANVLMTGQGQVYNDLLKSMQDAGGATDAAFAKVQTDSKEMKNSLNEIKNASIEIGDALAPVFKSVAKLAKDIAKFLSGLSEEQMKTITTILLVVAAIGPLLMTVGQLAMGISGIIGLATTLGPILAGVGVVIAGVTIPVWGVVAAIIAAIAAVIAIGVLLWKNWDKIMKFAAEMGTNIKRSFDDMMSKIGKWFDDVVARGAKLFDSFKNIGADIVEGMWEGIKSMGAWISEKVSGFFGGIADQVTSIFEFNPTSSIGTSSFMGKDFMKSLDSTKNSISSTGRTMGRNTAAAAATAGGSIQHSGTIRVEGVNDKGQVAAVVDIVMDEVRRGGRR